jgi:hypothetical protein
LIPLEQFCGAGVTVAVAVEVCVGVEVLVGVEVAGGAGAAARRGTWMGGAMLAMPGETTTNVDAMMPMTKAAEKSREKRLKPLSFL